MPRGAVPIAGVEGMGYSIFEKQEVWSDACAPLYEEAIQRRWRPATDVPWDSIEPLPDDLERAICQICTHISEKEQMEADVLGRWEPEISYGYHEVKLYLATTIFENARAVEVFRKRALSNGGGLGVQSPGWALPLRRRRAQLHRDGRRSRWCCRTASRWPSTQYGEKYAKNAAEKFIFAHCLQDKARHIAYGITHLKYVLLQPRRPPRGDPALPRQGRDACCCRTTEGSRRRARRSPSTSPAARTTSTKVSRIYDQMRKTAMQQYLARLKWATLDRSERLNSDLKAYLEK